MDGRYRRGREGGQVGFARHRIIDGHPVDQHEHGVPTAPSYRGDLRRARPPRIDGHARQGGRDLTDGPRGDGPELRAGQRPHTGGRRVDAGYHAFELDDVGNELDTDVRDRAVLDEDVALGREVTGRGHRQEVLSRLEAAEVEATRGVSGRGGSGDAHHGGCDGTTGKHVDHVAPKLAGELSPDVGCRCEERQRSRQIRKSPHASPRRVLRNAGVQVS